MTQDHSLHCSLSSGDGRRQIRDFSPERCNTGCTLACNCVGHKTNKLSLDKQCSDIRLNGVDVGRQTRRLPRSARQTAKWFRQLWCSFKRHTLLVSKSNNVGIASDWPPLVCNYDKFSAKNVETFQLIDFLEHMMSGCLRLIIQNFCKFCFDRNRLLPYSRLLHRSLR